MFFCWGAWGLVKHDIYKKNDLKDLEPVHPCQILNKACTVNKLYLVLDKDRNKISE